ncbi:MAG: hypothetical protein LBK83_05650 [Treponema sp.]|jgi:hypothetical protein|nr:hypothetical protein [Treponema sp.]
MDIETTIETTDGPAFLKHYTHLDRLLAILESGSLRLAGPEKWEDRNDSASQSVEILHKFHDIYVGYMCISENCSKSWE